MLLGPAVSIGRSGRGLRPQDVFATSLYTGTGAAKAITNGLDLSGGGLVWTKPRSNANGSNSHVLIDTARGGGKWLYSEQTSAEITSVPGISFGTSGYSIGSQDNLNWSGTSLASWSFCKAPKFFDIVTYTGDGLAGRQIAHSLSVPPGMVIVKCRSNSGYVWGVYHRSIVEGNVLFLNTTNGSSSGGPGFFPSAASSTTFTVGNDSTVNQAGFTYVAYLFAHNPSAEGIVQCGLATGGSKTMLGWKPQFVLIKPRDIAFNWEIFDSARGMDGTSDEYLRPNTSDAALADAGDTLIIDSTGFTPSSAHFGTNALVYLAIRAPTT